MFNFEMVFRVKREVLLGPKVPAYLVPLLVLRFLLIR